MAGTPERNQPLCWRRRPGFRYSRWDGTQVGFDLDADSLLDEMTDDLLYHGDLNAALRRMLQPGFQDRNGERLMGMREMLEKLRERRREELENHDLGGVYDDIAEQLREVVDMEREGIERAGRGGPPVGRPAPPGDGRGRRRAAAPRARAAAARPRRPGAGAPGVRVHWTRRRERFEELMDQLREQLMQSYFNQMSEGMQNMTPEHMQRMKDMLTELNQMLEQRERGEEPDFDGFMEHYGDFFPGTRRTSTSCSSRWRSDGGHAADAQLDDARAAGAAPGALRVAARGHGPALADRPARPATSSRRSRTLAVAAVAELQRRGPDGFGESRGLLQTRSATSTSSRTSCASRHPARRAGRGRRRPGPRAAGRRRRPLARAAGRAGPDARGRRAHRAAGGPARADAAGDPRASARTRSRPLPQADQGPDGPPRARAHRDRPRARATTTSPTSSATRSTSNVERTVATPSAAPVRARRCASHPTTSRSSAPRCSPGRPRCCMLDVSLSMPMRDNFLPAKKVAMALHSLITSQFPRDYFGLVVVRPRWPAS